MRATIAILTLFVQGLDPSQYKERPKPAEDLGVGDTFLLDDAERFKHCDK